MSTTPRPITTLPTNETGRKSAKLRYRKRVQRMREAADEIVHYRRRGEETSHAY